MLTPIVVPAAPREPGDGAKERVGRRRLEVFYQRHVRARHDEDVTVGQRLDIEKGYHVRLAGDDLGGNLAGDDATEDTGHGRPQNSQ